MEHVKSLIPKGDMTLAQIHACADIAVKMLDTVEAETMPSDMRDELMRLATQCTNFEILTPDAQDAGARLRFLVVSFMVLNDDEDPSD